MQTKNLLITYLGNELHNLFMTISESFFENIEEIRLRIGKPIIIYKQNKEYTITKDGKLSKNIFEGYCPLLTDLTKTIKLMSGYSLYAFDDEIKNGYITLQGGHRVGITGKVVMENNKIVTMKNINAINIRVSHQIKNCANSIIDYIIKPEIMHTMIISPPACGKTTLLRDIIRKISDGDSENFIGQTVGLVDERSEIAGCYMGIPQNDVGVRTDVLDGCPKSLGMLILLRSMSPKVIAVDEIGKENDINAIDDIINSGIKIICTVHGKNLQEISTKPILGDLLTRKIFQRYIVLSYNDVPGKVDGIFDKDFNIIL